MYIWLSNIVTSIKYTRYHFLHVCNHNYPFRFFRLTPLQCRIRKLYANNINISDFWQSLKTKSIRFRRMKSMFHSLKIRDLIDRSIIISYLWWYCLFNLSLIITADCRLILLKVHSNPKMWKSIVQTALICLVWDKHPWVCSKDA